MADTPNGRNSWHDIIDIWAALFTRDNLVIVTLGIIVMYSIYVFGAAQPGMVKEIILFVTGGLTGYLGGKATIS